MAITGPDAIGYIRWLNTSQADGYGLDDFGTVKFPSPLPLAAPVPEPASWIMLGVAMFLLWAAVGRRERK